MVSPTEESTAGDVTSAESAWASPSANVNKVIATAAATAAIQQKSSVSFASESIGFGRYGPTDYSTAPIETISDREWYSKGCITAAGGDSYSTSVSIGVGDGYVEDDLVGGFVDDLNGKPLPKLTSSKSLETGYETSLNYTGRRQNFVGLANQGATCYLNGLLQSLFMTPDFRRAVYSWRYDEKRDGPASESIPLQLQRLFGRLQLSGRSAIETVDLTNSFGWASGEAWLQQDVQELSRVLLDALDDAWKLSHTTEGDDEEKREGGEVMKKSTQPKSIIDELFGGELIDYLHCVEAPYSSERTDKLLDVSLSIQSFHPVNDEDDENDDKNTKNPWEMEPKPRSLHTLHECFQEFLRPEVLDGDNKISVDLPITNSSLKKDENDEILYEKVRSAAVKGLKFGCLPPLLAVHLKRFVFDWSGVSVTQKKLEDEVRFPHILDMNPYVAKRRRRDDDVVENENESEWVKNEEFDAFLQNHIHRLREKISHETIGKKNEIILDSSKNVLEDDYDMSGDVFFKEEKVHYDLGDVGFMSISPYSDLSDPPSDAAQVPSEEEESMNIERVHSRDSSVDVTEVFYGKVSDDGFVMEDIPLETDKSNLDWQWDSEFGETWNTESNLEGVVGNSITDGDEAGSEEDICVVGDLIPTRCDSPLSNLISDTIPITQSLPDDPINFTVPNVSSAVNNDGPDPTKPVVGAYGPLSDDEILSLVQTRGEWIYELYAVLVHSGALTRGHYFAYAQDLRTKRWWRFNDSMVSEISAEDVAGVFGSAPRQNSNNLPSPGLSKMRGYGFAGYNNRWSGRSDGCPTAYMLMYRRVDPAVLAQGKLGREAAYSVSDDLIPPYVREELATEEAERKEEMRLAAERAAHITLRVSYAKKNQQISVRKGTTIRDLLKKVWDEMEVAKLILKFAEEEVARCEKGDFEESGEESIEESRRLLSELKDMIDSGAPCLELLRLQEITPIRTRRIFSLSTTDENVSVTDGVNCLPPLATLQIRLPGKAWDERTSVSVSVYDPNLDILREPVTVSFQPGKLWSDVKPTFASTLRIPLKNLHLFLMDRGTFGTSWSATSTSQLNSRSGWGIGNGVLRSFRDSDPVERIAANQLIYAEDTTGRYGEQSELVAAGEANNIDTWDALERFLAVSIFIRVSGLEKRSASGELSIRVPRRATPTQLRMLILAEINREVKYISALPPVMGEEYSQSVMSTEWTDDELILVSCGPPEVELPQHAEIDQHRSTLRECSRYLAWRGKAAVAGTTHFRLAVEKPDPDIKKINGPMISLCLPPQSTDDLVIPNVCVELTSASAPIYDDLPTAEGILLPSTNLELESEVATDGVLLLPPPPPPPATISQGGWTDTSCLGLPPAEVEALLSDSTLIPSGISQRRYFHAGASPAQISSLPNLSSDVISSTTTVDELLSIVYRQLISCGELSPNEEVVFPESSSNDAIYKEDNVSAENAARFISIRRKNCDTALRTGTSLSDSGFSALTALPSFVATVISSTDQTSNTKFQVNGMNTSILEDNSCVWTPSPNIPLVQTDPCPDGTLSIVLRRWKVSSLSFGPPMSVTLPLHRRVCDVAAGLAVYFGIAPSDLRVAVVPVGSSVTLPSLVAIPRQEEEMSAAVIAEWRLLPTERELAKVASKQAKDWANRCLAQLPRDDSESDVSDPPVSGTGWISSGNYNGGWETDAATQWFDPFAETRQLKELRSLGSGDLLILRSLSDPSPLPILSSADRKSFIVSAPNNAIPDDVLSSSATTSGGYSNWHWPTTRNASSLQTASDSTSIGESMYSGIGARQRYGAYSLLPGRRDADSEPLSYTSSLYSNVGGVKIRTAKDRRSESGADSTAGGAAGGTAQSITGGGLSTQSSSCVDFGELSAADSGTTSGADLSSPPGNTKII